MEATSIMKKIIGSVLLIALLALFVISEFLRGTPNNEPKPCRYIKEVKSQTCRQTISRSVTIKDECGNQEKIKVVFYHAIQVPEACSVKTCR